MFSHAAERSSWEVSSGDGDICEGQPFRCRDFPCTGRGGFLLGFIPNDRCHLEAAPHCRAGFGLGQCSARQCVNAYGSFFPSFSGCGGTGITLIGVFDPAAWQSPMPRPRVVGMISPAYQ
jgi:hypothetical protein